ADPNLRVSITAPAGDATNVGQLIAQSGSLGLFGTVVRNSGPVSADSATMQGGRIVFKASQRVDAGGMVSAQGAGGGQIKILADMQAGTVNVTGKLDASAPSSGNGGFIDTSAAHVRVANTASVTTHAGNGTSGTWLIDPTDFTIAATGGNMTGATLSTSLVAGNVSILSSSGTGGTAGDVNVNDVVSWSANTLTLNAQNNININSTMNGTGTASLALLYGQGAVASGNTSTYNVNAPVHLPAGLNFSTKLGSNGSVVNYMVITSLGAAGSTTGTDLQGINGSTYRNYALGSNIDATATSTWNTGAGFLPLGLNATFDGLGHTINNLFINRPTTEYVGLFGSVNAVIRNVGLVGGSVTGNTWVGALVGILDSGSIKNAYSTANVSGVEEVGGLVGNLQPDCSITNAYASGNLTLISGVGRYDGTSGGWFGGLVGWNNGAITNSYATGNVNGLTVVVNAGGLVGIHQSFSGSVITNSYATGRVSGARSVGGLVGLNNSGNIVGSFWDTQTSGTTVGVGSGILTGPTGMTTAQMQQQVNFTSSTPANGNVNPGWNFTNTWVMYNGFTYPLLRSFMMPLTVTANNAGKSYDGLAYSGGNGVSYSSSPSANLLGTVSYGGTSQGAITPGNYFIIPGGLYSNQQGYIISYGDGALTVNPAALSVTAVAASKTYDGLAYSGGNGVAYSGFVNGETNAVLGGTLAYGGTSQGAINAGNYLIAPSGLTSGNYTISYVNGALTINSVPTPAPVAPQPVVSSLVSMSIPTINIPFNPPIQQTLTQAPTIDDINTLAPTAAGSDNQAVQDVLLVAAVPAAEAAAPLPVCH
ncbi:MAG: MBG domain-containing protein, partial [Gallionella sp.]